MPVRFLSGGPAGAPVDVSGGAGPGGIRPLLHAERRGPAREPGPARCGNRLGWALQLCGLRMLGFCRTDVATAPASGVNFLARQLGVAPHSLATYGERAQTRTDHVNQVKAIWASGRPRPAIWRRSGSGWQQRRWCRTARSCCFTWRAKRLYQLRLTRPGLTVVEQSLVGIARKAARKEIARRLAPQLSSDRRLCLDALLEVDAEVGMARATWLRQLPVQASPRVMHDEMDKLEFSRALGVEGWDMSALPAKRIATLAAWAPTASNQALAQSSEEVRSASTSSWQADEARIVRPDRDQPGKQAAISSSQVTSRAMTSVRRPLTDGWRSVPASVTSV